VKSNPKGVSGNPRPKTAPDWEVCPGSHFVEGLIPSLFTHATQQEQECTTV